jgi:chromosome segregation ATPase
MTDTPFTDKHASPWVPEPNTDWVPAYMVRELEREFNASKAEVAKLNHQLLKTESDLLQSQDINSFLDAEFRIACKRAEKAEAQSESRRQSLAFALNEIKKAEAEVKEIRSALGDDGRRTHKEILEMAFKASGWKLWKEKYIDLRNAHIAEGQDPAGTIWEHADKLQKELKETKAEVERLDQMVEWFIENAPHFTLAQFNEYQRTLNSTDK